MTEEKKPFTVTDRRLFTSEGERRDPSQTADADPAPAPQAPPRPDPAPPRRAAPGPGMPAMDFTAFLLNLAAQASLLLGQGGQPPDLEGAREVISILEMLRDKTEGRRTPEEDEVLEGVLYELRMVYLKRAGVPGA